MEKGNYNPYDEDVEIIQDDDNLKIVKVAKELTSFTTTKSYACSSLRF